MDISIINVMVLANNFEELVDWYKKVFNLEVIIHEKGETPYIELGIGKRVLFGLTPAEAVEHKPSPTRNNSTLIQLNVSDIEGLFKIVKENDGKIVFGPEKDEKYNFLCGSILDLEGNEIWIIQM